MSSKFVESMLKGYVDFCNKNTSEKIPLRMFSLWPETNFLLDEFYLRPSIKIGNDKKGLRVKNSMRHITGSARQYQNYPNSAEFLGDLKEKWDFLTEPFIYMKYNKSLNYQKYLDKTKRDSIIDQENNQIGRNFAKQNPKATDEDIMQYAYNQALSNYKRQYEPTPILKATPNNVLNWDGFGNFYYTCENKPQKQSTFVQKMLENDSRGLRKN